MAKRMISVGAMLLAGCSANVDPPVQPARACHVELAVERGVDEPPMYVDLGAGSCHTPRSMMIAAAAEPLLVALSVEGSVVSSNVERADREGTTSFLATLPPPPVGGPLPVAPAVMTRHDVVPGAWTEIAAGEAYRVLVRIVRG